MYRRTRGKKLTHCWFGLIHEVQDTLGRKFFFFYKGATFNFDLSGPISKKPFVRFESTKHKRRVNCVFTIFAKFLQTACEPVWTGCY